MVSTSDLLYAFETAFHALDGHKLARLYALRFQHLGEGPFALLREHTILCTHKPGNRVRNEFDVILKCNRNPAVLYNSGSHSRLEPVVECCLTIF